MFPAASRTGRALAALRDVAERVTGPGGLLDDVLGDPVPPPAPHPHRRPLARRRLRRAGTVAPRPQPCLSPVGAARTPAGARAAPGRAAGARSPVTSR